MAPPRVDMERFGVAVKFMTDIGVSKKTVERVLNKLLILYEYNWEHIEADNYRTLADAIFDESDPAEDEKKQAEKKNLDSDHRNKKLKMKHRGQSSKSNFHSNCNREPAEVPCQEHQGESSGNRKASRIQLLEPSTQSFLKERKINRHIENSSALSFESRERHSYETHRAPNCNREPAEVPCQEQQGESSGNRKASRIQLLKPSTQSFLKERKIDRHIEISSALSFESRERHSYETHRGEQHVDSKKLTHLVSHKRDMADGGSSVGVRPNNSTDVQIIHRVPTRGKRQWHDVNDIAKGEERVRIPIVTGPDNKALPPPFTYIPQNIASQDAYVNSSLARIGDENCCPECFGDCLAAPLPCACAAETGGEFAYTRDGLLQKEFLDACITIYQEPQKYHHFYCKVCPLEKLKIDRNSDSPKTKVDPDPCKGHLIRKFIKECWRKCGCTRNCGNRVVQRGITRSLQVFLSPDEKGWGLRTAEKLPEGAFVCEYVGEILTNTELYERNNQRTGNVKHTYPLNLNADWGTEGVLEDDEALCLDGTFYGNVARFINHRCFDGNLIGIPVEIETPDHHYYHLAFFTKREVEPYEELTWDYEIDFDDVNHPIKAFKCLCGSPYCRDKKC